MDKILNVPNAQRALSIVRKQLNEINITKSELFNDIEFYYTLADKYTKDGRRFFKLLNQSKDSLRSLRNEENSLILMSKLLKKFIRENKEELTSTTVISYLPTVSEFNDRCNKCGTSDLIVNKLFPTVSYKDVERWFKNNPDKEYIELFGVELSNNSTHITESIKVYKDFLKVWKEDIKLYTCIFSADCFSSKNSKFIGAGHRKEYVQKCIDLYGSVICKFKNDSIDTEEYSNRATEISGTENDHFQGVFFNWKYVEVTIENFR